MNGILMKEGQSVTLDAAEKALQDFVDALSILEGDLSRRWAEVEN
jgi:hypothetical protein